MNSFREIVLAIEKYKDDIIKFPIYFDADSLIYLDSDESINNISEKIQNKNYKPDYPTVYKIPYDSVSTRLAHNLQIDDHIIRYYLLNHYQKNIELYTTQINPDNYKVHCIVDIYDCYNQIGKEIFYKTLEKGYSNKVDRKYLDIVNQILDYGCQNWENQIGLILGNKTDEYFAELFLSVVHSELNIQVSENISRIGDEFFICTNSISELRNHIEKISEVLLNYGLRINKSKNHVNFLNEKRNITRIIPFEEPYPNATSSYPGPSFPTINYNEITYVKTIGKQVTDENILEINSYENSIKYLKNISPEVDRIENLVKKYSPYSLYGFWDSSTPSEEKQLHNIIDFETILNPIVLDNLETILYRYPRSQYFSAMAIKNICNYAKNMDYSHNDSCEKDEKNAFIIESYDFSKYNSKTSSFLCEKSNSILLNAIRSSDIFDFQKYLILRELFFNKKTLKIELSNYNVSGKIPYPILFENEFKRLLENEYDLEFPLRTIINNIMCEKNYN